MKLSRVLASFVNSILFIVNFVLWILNMKPLGQKIWNTWCPESRKEQFVFGLFSALMYISIILFIINIYFWFKDEESIAVRLTKMVF
ncbi:hypothetical protein ESOMN_v1c04730 [Williamsoniiplasma somnilux]|uniref:Uncharacterized protein n=1 Tax=Williamsoniiplasma somnilux TaxID=215578 RepID=A0A2K8NYF4_9MOLU|nr:hypothetical protein [Williamsoniiplasma somnilux]ATZ18855.1 hypothetical protein ESOMN_v1c04730 [Williamsoniiplasma somnilux]